MTNEKRGGIRPGAGRKPSGKVQVNLFIAPDCREAIKAQAKELSCSYGEVIERLMAYDR